MKIVNLTPHDVTIKNKNNETVFYAKKSDKPARCKVEYFNPIMINGIEVRTSQMGKVYDLPEPKADTIYIVSRQVAEKCKGQRQDLYITDRAVRGVAKTGQSVITHVLGLAKLK
jgi:ribosomal 30S subunit maturation factor RimM